MIFVHFAHINDRERSAGADDAPRLHYRGKIYVWIFDRV